MPRAALLLACLLAAAPGRAQEPSPHFSLVNLSLEDLMNIEVRTAARREQPLFDAAAAAFVLTRDDIRRAGVTALPEALRLVPGLHVARLESSNWAISIRGFNGDFANKLLVLIDGRVVYTPLFSGVFWDEHDLPLSEIERIEVIRGPGAALWGANAVNGVINIITAEARQTQGLLLRAGGGPEERALVDIRYGGRAGDRLHWRLWGRYADRDAHVDSAGAAANDQWHQLRGGGRADWGEQWVFDVSYFAGTNHQTITNEIVSFTPPYTRTYDSALDQYGLHLRGRWTGAATQAQLDFTRADFTYDGSRGETRNTYGLDLQHQLPGAAIAGLTFRRSGDRFQNSFDTFLAPAGRAEHQASAFLQGDLGLARRLRLTLGARAEWYTDNDWHLLPNARLIWQSGRHALWGAAARALRTPSRLEDDGRFYLDILPPDSLFTGAPLTLVTLAGDRGAELEKLRAFEVGYRTQLGDRLFVDAAAFYNRYDDLINVEPAPGYADTTFGVAHGVLPLVVANKLLARTRGAELTLDGQPAPGWRLRAAYSYLHADLELAGDSADPYSGDFLDLDPRHQAWLRSAHDLTADLEFDWVLRYVDRLRDLAVPSYLALDARLGFTPVAGLHLSLAGRNLLDARHLEYRPDFDDVLPTQIQRDFVARATWSF